MTDHHLDARGKNVAKLKSPVLRCPTTTDPRTTWSLQADTKLCELPLPCSALIQFSSSSMILCVLHLSNTAHGCRNLYPSGGLADAAEDSKRRTVLDAGRGVPPIVVQPAEAAKDSATYSQICLAHNFSLSTKRPTWTR